MNLWIEGLALRIQGNHLAIHSGESVVHGRLAEGERPIIVDRRDGGFRDSNTEISRAIQHPYRQVGILPHQGEVLSCLWRKDKVSQQVICDLTQKDKPSVTRLIDNLERKNLVVRVPDTADRRINLIHLTAEGASLKQKTTKVVRHVVNTAVEGIPHDTLLQSKDILIRIMRNLEQG